MYVKKIREAVGGKCDLLFGTHGQMTTSSAIRLARRLEKYDPLWFEEPVPPENIEEIKDLELLLEKSTTRERVRRALDHQEPDRIPFILGGCTSTTIMLPAYQQLKKYLGIEKGTPEFMSRVQHRYRAKRLF